MTTKAPVLRFAPSPTGFLHVGGARTALFNYFYARRLGGKFILRIEDTDLERSKKEYEVEILESMKWLGMDWDADPIYQTQRFDVYRGYVDAMLKAGTAYKCWATPEELEKMRELAQAEGRKPMYDRRFRDFKGVEPDGPYVVRFKAPLSGVTVLNDLIKGRIEFANEEIDDFIILRSDSSPTYNFTVVVDDVEMKITHVLRGDDHVMNTPKQILLMQAMGMEAPQYAHIPMVLGPDKVKLSKRHGAVAVTQYREQGYLPEAMINALIRLGWGHGDQEIFSKEDLKKVFDISGCGSSPSVFDRAKLDHLNAHYIKQKTLPELQRLLKETYGVDVSYLMVDARSQKMFEALRDRAVRLTDFPALLSWTQDTTFVQDESAKEVLAQSQNEWIQALVQRLQALPDEEFVADKVFNEVKESAKALGIKLPQLAKAARALLTGTMASPDLGLCFEYLGKQRSLTRLHP